MYTVILLKIWHNLYSSFTHINKLRMHSLSTHIFFALCHLVKGTKFMVVELMVAVISSLFCKGTSKTNANLAI